jgi:quercetin dioxygenase-like cupin family protein
MHEKNTSELLAKPLRLKELTAYQPGAIVSRTLVDNEVGTVTIFAFDEGQGLSEHKAPYDAMVIVVEGDVNINISGERFDLKEDEMIILPANKPHALKALTKFKMILIMIRMKEKRDT